MFKRSNSPTDCPSFCPQIILEHQKSGEEVMDLGKFFKGLRYLQKAFTLQSYVAKPKKEKKKKGEKGKGKFLLPAPICVMPRHLIRRRPDAGLPTYMIEKCLAALESGFFVPDHCPRNAIEDDRAWYTDPPEKVRVCMPRLVGLCCLLCVVDVLFRVRVCVCVCVH